MIFDALTARAETRPEEKVGERMVERVVVVGSDVS